MMNLAERYIKAAEAVDKDYYRKDKSYYYNGACTALRDQGISRYDPEFKYLGLFRPNHKGHNHYWWGMPATCSPEQHNARVLALLFAAEIIKDEAA